MTIFFDYKSSLRLQDGFYKVRLSQYGKA